MARARLQNLNLTATVTPVEIVDELMVHLGSFKPRGEIVKKAAIAFLKKPHYIRVVKVGRKYTMKLGISIAGLTLKLKITPPDKTYQVEYLTALLKLMISADANKTFADDGEVEEGLAVHVLA